jgi:hypothetical protein
MWRDAVSDDSVVLHLAYSSPGDVAAKAHRSCPEDHLNAARRGDRAKVGGGELRAGPALAVQILMGSAASTDVLASWSMA